VRARTQRAYLALASISLFGAAFGVARAARADEAQETSADYAISPEGHRYRVRFDPASRIFVGLSGALVRDADRPLALAAELDAGIWYRAMYARGKGSERVTWQVDHRWVSGYVMPARQLSLGVPALDATLYEVSALRHDLSPRLILPMSPPVRLPFPFDVGIELELGRVSVPAYLPPALVGGAGVPMAHVGVVRGAFLLDPWRSGAAGRSLELGVGVLYDMDFYAEPTFETPKVVHRVAPMTAVHTRFRLQSDDGLSVLDVRGELVPHWTSESIWRVLASSSVRAERTLVAINDQPIAATLEGVYRYWPETKQVEAVHDVRVSVGVKVALQLE